MAVSMSDCSSTRENGRPLNLVNGLSSCALPGTESMPSTVMLSTIVAGPSEIVKRTFTAVVLSVAMDWRLSRCSSPAGGSRSAGAARRGAPRACRGSASRRAGSRRLAAHPAVRRRDDRILEFGRGELPVADELDVHDLAVAEVALDALGGGKRRRGGEDEREEGAAHHASARPARALRASCITRSCVRVVRASAMRSQGEERPRIPGGPLK